MKKGFILLCIIYGLLACTKPPFEHVELSYPDGSPQVVKLYKSPEMKVLLKKIEYHENGAKRIEGTYKNGKRNGEWTAWYDNGNLWSKGFYSEGVENGMKTVWHKNGQKYYEGPIVNDERTGTWKFWDEKGKLVKEIDYENRKQMR